jgi:hypothetical protein
MTGERKMKKAVTVLVIFATLCVAACTQRKSDTKTDESGTVTTDLGQSAPDSVFKNREPTSVTIPETVTAIYGERDFTIA